MQLSVRPIRLSSGVQVVVIDVEEFRDIPHFCKKGYPDVLRRGALYVRPRGKPEPVEVSGPTELREIVELATAKQVRQFVRIAQAAGVELGVAQPADLADGQYAAEAEQSWVGAATEQLAFIEARGHWEVSTRPKRYQETRIPFGDLADLRKSTRRAFARLATPVCG